MALTNPSINGSGTGNVQTTLQEPLLLEVEDICKSAKINKWSFAKPVNFNAVSPDRSSDVWKEGSGSRDVCGLNTAASGKEVYSTALGTGLRDYSVSSGGVMNILENFNASFFGKLKAQSPEWVYDRPTGGLTSPYRLNDFNGYAHGAASPMPVPDNKTITSSGNYGYYTVTIPATVLDGRIELSLMRAKWIDTTKYFAKFYVAALFYNEASGKCFWETCLAPIDGTGAQLPADNHRMRIQYNDELLGKVWKVYLFLTETRVSSYDDWTAGHSGGVNVFACCSGSADMVFSNIANPITISRLTAVWMDQVEIPSQLRTVITLDNSVLDDILPSSIIATVRNKSTQSVLDTFSITPSTATAISSTTIIDNRRFIYPGTGYEMQVVVTYDYDGSTKTATSIIDLTI